MAAKTKMQNKADRRRRRVVNMPILNIVRSEQRGRYLQGALQAHLSQSHLDLSQPREHHAPSLYQWESISESPGAALESQVGLKTSGSCLTLFLRSHGVAF